MATAFVAAARGFNITSAATVTSDSITPSGTNRAIYAWVLCGDASPRVPDTVKFNTTESFSLVASIAVGSFRNLSLWRLFSPTATAATVVADWTTSVGERMILLQALEKVNPDTPNGTAATATGTGLTLSSTANTVSGNLVIDGVYYLESGGPTSQTLTAGAGQTSRTEIDSTDLGDQGMGSSTETAAASTTVMSWTLNAGATDSWGSISVNINPPVGPTINTQPSSATKNVGETATFNITATTSGGTLSYQWKVNGSNVGTDSNSYTTGTLTNSNQWDAITCVVTDDNGSTTSSAAVLTIAFAAAGTGPRRRNIIGAHPIGSLGWLGIVSSGSVSAAAYSAGVATDIAVGSSTVQANALSSAVSTALAIGAATTRADAFTQGAATDIAVGVSRISGDAYTQGTSTAQAVGSSSASTASDAYSAGIATDIATGQSTVASDAYTQGTSTAQAVGSTGAAATTADAYSAGASTAQATGAIIVQAAGYSAGVATAQAVGSGSAAAGNTIIRLGARNPWAVKKGMDTVDQENEEILQLLAELVPLISQGHMHHAPR